MKINQLVFSMLLAVVFVSGFFLAWRVFFPYAPISDSSAMFIGCVLGGMATVIGFLVKK
jgi:hypothetical protein